MVTQRLTGLALGLALAHTASAAEGFYHPSDVAAASSAFARAQEVAANAFDEASERDAAVASSLAAFEVALDVLGDRAPADQRDRLTMLTRAYHRDHAVLQTWAQDQLNGFNLIFSEALERAVGNAPLERCRTREASGPRFTRGSGGVAQTCEGTNANAQVAQRLDNDRLLQTQLDDLLGEAWPTMTVEPQAVAAMTRVGSTREATHAVPLEIYLARGLRAPLREIEQADRDARLVFQAAIEEGASNDELEAMKEQAAGITATTAKRREILAAGGLAASEKLFKALGKMGATEPAWCAQPAFFGGCGLPIAPDRALKELSEHIRVQRAFEMGAVALSRSDVALP